MYSYVPVFTLSPYDTLLATQHDLPCRASGNREFVMDLVQDGISKGRALMPHFTYMML
jgi:hypothetical protein